MNEEQNKPKTVFVDIEFTRIGNLVDILNKQILNCKV